MTAKSITNSLAIDVDNFIKSKGIKKTYVAQQMGISYSYFNKLLAKDNFTINDANRILLVIGYRIDYEIKTLWHDTGIKIIILLSIILRLLYYLTQIKV